MITGFAHEPHSPAQLVMTIYCRQHGCAGKHQQTNSLHTAELALKFFLTGNSAIIHILMLLYHLMNRLSLNVLLSFKARLMARSMPLRLFR